MAQRLLKRQPRTVASGRAVAPRPPQPAAVLVGTYKDKQLAGIGGFRIAMQRCGGGEVMQIRSVA